MRLIDADALAEVVNHWGEIKGREEAADSIIYAIKEAPAIEAEPVRHRTWVIKTHDDGYGEYQVKHCPDCDRGLPVEYDASYCPNCGAKMD